jgi:hypothetical protein
VRYSLLLMDISVISSRYQDSWSYISNHFNLKEDEKESCYDWIVTQGVNELLMGYFVKMSRNHFRHDVYKCVYDMFERDINQCLFSQFLINQATFVSCSDIKIMVTGNTLIIARGTPN